MVPRGCPRRATADKSRERLEGAEPRLGGPVLERPGGFTSWSLWWKVVLPGLFGFFKLMRYKIIITVCTDGWPSETGIGKRAERLRTAAASALQKKALSLWLVKRKHKVVWPSKSAPWPRRVFPAGQHIHVRPLSAPQPHRSYQTGLERDCGYM